MRSTALDPGAASDMGTKLWFLHGLYNFLAVLMIRIGNEVSSFKAANPPLIILLGKSALKKMSLIETYDD